MFIMIFAENELRHYLESVLRNLQQEVYAQDKNYLLNANETQYIEYLVNHYQIEPLVLHWNEKSVSDREELIDAEQFPPGFTVTSGRSYRKSVITYHIPYSGKEVLLSMSPSLRILWTERVKPTKECISFDIINWRDDADEIKRKADEFQNKVSQQAGNLTKEMLQFNSKLEGEAKTVVQARKSELLKQANLVASLGVTLKKAEQEVSTFAVPVTKKKIIVKKPASPKGSFTPEPTLDEGTYQDILEMIHDAGVAMERHPSIYSDKDEEVLRDFFLMVLSPHFDSTTGETFNKVGKTDILIRHEKQNIFVAECAFWHGIKLFYGKVDQLLGYLTWRDSKSAIMCFIKNKEVTPVLSAIEQDMEKHPCFVKYWGKKTEGWFMFEFHLKEDSTRSVQLAVLCFHLP